MASTNTTVENQKPPDSYEVRLKGHLDARWTGWFDGFTITLTDRGETILTGSVADQAALHGLLKKVRDLGLPLLSINPINV
ncbi:MAG: hypothetical protein ACE5E7_18305 [Anaerolineae bacterium]